LFAFKLSRQSGDILWTVDLPDAWKPTALAPDPSGNTILVASTGRSPTRRLVAKVSPSGHLLWQTTLSKGDNLAVAVNAEGDVFAAGAALVPSSTTQAAPVLSVVKLNGETGTRLWEYQTDLVAGGKALAVTADAAGDAYVAGTLGVGGYEQFSVLKLNGTLGDPRWTRIIPGSAVGTNASATDLVLDDQGRLDAAGSLASQTGELDFGITSLDATSGSDDMPCRFGRSCGGRRPRLVIPTVPGLRLPRR
jgi:outer membrane protein assembly factor BamB